MDKKSKRVERKIIYECYYQKSREQIAYGFFDNR